MSLLTLLLVGALIAFSGMSLNEVLLLLLR